MSRTRRLAAAIALTCAGVVLTGCSSGGKNTGAPSSTTADDSSLAGSDASSSESDSDFDITLVPATSSPPVSSSTATSSSSSADATSKPTASTTPGPSPSPAVAAGRVFAFIKKVDVPTRALTYDQAQFLTGDAANRAAAEDKQEVPVPNDYYIRNVNKKLRTAPVAADAALLGSIALTQQVDLSPVTLDDIASFAATDQAALVGFWITIDGKGNITKVEEQYVP